MKNNRSTNVIAVLACLATCMLLLNFYAVLFVVAPANLTWGGRKPFLSLRLSSNQFSIDYDTLAASLVETTNGLAINVPSKPDEISGWVDTLAYGPGGTVEVSGWAFNQRSNESAELVVLFHEGAPIQIIKIGVYRPDVAKVLGNPNAKFSGFEARNLIGVNIDFCTVKVFAISYSMLASELPLAKGICSK